MINGVVDTLKQSEMDSVKETGELIETGSNANDALTLYTIVAAILIGGTGYGLFIKK